MSLSGKKERFALNLRSLDDFNDLYPGAESEAMAKSIPVIDVYQCQEFITSIDIEKYRRAKGLYSDTRAILCRQENFN